MPEGKWIPGLHPVMPVGDAARVVLASRFETVRYYLPSAVEKPYEDTEYVHQLRVGTRRAAAALRVFGDCLPKKRLKAAGGYLRLIRRAAGDARDWDVFLQAMTATQERASEGDGPALDFLLGYALGERAAAQVRLASAAAQAGPDFAPDTAALPYHARDPETGPSTLGELAARELGELLREFTAAVEANPEEPADLHRLRILGKRLRYSMELFAACFPPVLLERYYPAVEELQETLGDLQDAAVGSARLEALRDTARQLIPAEWPRLETGFDALLAGLREKVPAGREKFRALRDGWLRLVGEQPLASPATGAETPEETLPP